MQIVPVSRRFRQKVLQFVFFFFHPVPLSNDPGYWFQKMCKRTQNDRGNFQRRFMIISKNARLKEVLSDYQKWRFQFQILQILTCTIVTQNVDGKFHRHFQGIAENFHRRLLIMQKAKPFSTAAIFKWRWKILPSVLHKRQKRKYSLQNHFSNRL